MEDPKAKPSGLDAIKKGLAPDGSYLIVETNPGPEQATVLVQVTEAVERFREGLGKELFAFLERSFSKFETTLDKTLAVQEALAARLAELDRKHDALRSEATALAAENAAARERLAAANAGRESAESQLAKVKEALR